MKKKTLTFEVLYTSQRPYAGGDQHALIRQSKCEVLWSNSLGLAVVTIKGTFATRQWLRVGTHAMACHERSEALKQGMALVEVLENSHAASKAGNHEEAYKLIQLVEAFGNPHRWYQAMYGDQEPPPAKDPPAAAPGLPN